MKASHAAVSSSRRQRLGGFQQGPRISAYVGHSPNAQGVAQTGSMEQGKNTAISVLRKVLYKPILRKWHKSTATSAPVGGSRRVSRGWIPPPKRYRYSRPAYPGTITHRDVRVSGTQERRGWRRLNGRLAGGDIGEVQARPKPLMLRSWAPLGLAGQVESDQPYHVGPGDAFRPLEVISDGRYDLAPLNRAVGVVPDNRGVPTGRPKLKPR